MPFVKYIYILQFTIDKGKGIISKHRNTCAIKIQIMNMNVSEQGYLQNRLRK